MADTTKRSSIPDPAVAKPSEQYLALAGVVGPILFVLIFTIAGFLRPGYSALRDAVSELGVGDNAWIQNTNFLVFGALIMSFALGVFRALRHVTG